MPRKRKTIISGQAGELTVVKWSSAPSECRQAYVIGWQSMMSDESWHPAYDALSEDMQRWYENGRLDAANVLLLVKNHPKHNNLPFWGTISDRPKEIRNAIAWSNYYYGEAR